MESSSYKREVGYLCHETSQIQDAKGQESLVSSPEATLDAARSLLRQEESEEDCFL